MRKVMRVLYPIFLLGIVLFFWFAYTNWSIINTPRQLAKVNKLVDHNGKIDDPQDELRFRGPESVVYKVRKDRVDIKFGTALLSWKKKDFMQDKDQVRILERIGLKIRWNPKNEKIKVEYKGVRCKELYR